MRRAVAAVTIGVAVLLSAGCATASGTGGSGSPTASPSPTGSTVPPDFIAEFGGSFSGLDTATTLDPAKAELLGPHSVLQLDAVARTATLTEEQAGELDVAERHLSWPLHARSGHELVLAHIAPTNDTQPALPNYTGDTQGAAKPSLVIDGTNHAFSREIFGDETIVAQVPTGAPVKLRMNDAGRPQELDLRTGKRTRSASPLYYPVREASPSFADAYYVLGNGSTTGLMSSSNAVTLAPYADRIGWARKGHAWLLVSLGIATSSQTQFKPNVTGSVTLSASGARSTGRALRSGDTSTNDNTAAASGSLDLVFDVPASMRSGTLNYLPVGSFVVDGKTVSASPYRSGDPQYDTTTQHKHFTLEPRS